MSSALPTEAYTVHVARWQAESARRVDDGDMRWPKPDAGRAGKAAMADSEQQCWLNRSHFSLSILCGNDPSFCKTISSWIIAEQFSSKHLVVVPCFDAEDRRSEGSKYLIVYDFVTVFPERALDCRSLVYILTYNILLSKNVLSKIARLKKDGNFSYLLSIMWFNTLTTTIGKHQEATIKLQIELYCYVFFEKQLYCYVAPLETKKIINMKLLV